MYHLHIHEPDADLPRDQTEVADCCRGIPGSDTKMATITADEPPEKSKARWDRTRLVGWDHSTQRAQNLRLLRTLVNDANACAEMRAALACCLSRLEAISVSRRDDLDCDVIDKARSAIDPHNSEGDFQQYPTTGGRMPNDPKYRAPVTDNRDELDSKLTADRTLDGLAADLERPGNGDINDYRAEANADAADRRASDERHAMESRDNHS